ncbi:MAG: metal-dependent hydrolase [Lyngbya sp.]|nr:metal-dependent hydrolase [Lyngbya sp.]
MPSPVGHSLAGVCGYILAQPHIPKRHRLSVLFASVFIANAPDLDILVGIVLRGEPGIFHRQATHSLIVAILIGLLTALIARSVKLKEWNWLGLWTGGVYTSHIFLDLMVADDALPFGVQAFWPFTADYFIFPLTIFGGFNYGGSGLFGFLFSLFTFQNLIFILQEIVILAPCIWLTWLWEKYRRKKAYLNR